MTGLIRLHPDRPRRFLWQGKAKFLIGSTEHYGVLLNTAFDYRRYVETLAVGGASG